MSMLQDCSPPQYGINLKTSKQVTSAPIGRKMMHASSCSPPRYPIAIKPLPQNTPHVPSPHITNANQLTPGISSTTLQAGSKKTKQMASAPIGRRMMHECSCSPPRYPLFTKAFPKSNSSIHNLSCFSVVFRYLYVE